MLMVSPPLLQTLHKKLERAFRPSFLDVTDESAQHRGHAGAPAGGSSHFAIRIQAGDLSSLPPLAQHRLIYKVLATELKEGIHALRIQVIPFEQSSQDKAGPPCKGTPY